MMAGQGKNGLNRVRILKYKRAGIADAVHHERALGKN
jgi:hypothetical protein